MKHFTLICFVFISLYTQAQTTEPFLLTRDSLDAILDARAWKFNDAADSIGMAAKSYDDSKWLVGRSKVRMDNDSVRKRFKGFGWFRFHLRADSTVINIPMTLAITQSGASEVYWDGELIGKGGVIKGEDSSEYYNPRFEPFLFTIKDTGEHVIAVRYANYDAEKNEARFTFSGAGFIISINTAANFIEEQSDTTMGRMLLILLFSLFASFSLVHLMLFLYNRRQISNLYFSIFACTISLAFLFSTISMVTSWVSLLIYVRHAMLPTLCLACLSLSGVINSVFPDKRKIRFWILAGIAIVVMIQSLFALPLLTVGVVIMLGLTTLETVVKIIIAVIKKRPGSRIIGFGFFFLAFFVLTILLSILIVGDFVINDDSPLGIAVGISIILSIFSIPFSMSAYLAKNYATVNKDLKNQLEQVKLLSDKTLQQELEKQQMLESRKEELEKEVAIRTSEVLIQKEKIEKQHEELKTEKKKSDDLLLNILPGEVADELKEYGFAKAKQYNNVSVLFTDFVNFTGISSELSAEQLVSEIDKCFKAFDEIMGRNGLEKIKTIGDAYLAVCGLPNDDPDHAKKVTRAAVEIRDYITSSKNNGGIFDIRIGIHSGPVVAGIVGVKKFAYDIWGDTVNTAARMEQNSETGKINISGATFELIRDEFTCEYRGKIEARNKGMIDMYFVN